MTKYTILLVALVAVLGLVTSAEAGLRAHWKFDEAPGSSTATDSSGGGNPGEVRGDATFAPGIVGNALSLDGEGDYVWVPFDSSEPDALDLDMGDFTVSMWTNLVGRNHHQNMFSLGWINAGGGTIEVVWLNDGRLIGAIAGHPENSAAAKVELDRSILVPGGTATALDPEGTGIYDRWAHVAITRNVAADEFSLYLDGELQSTLNDVAGDLTIRNSDFGVQLGKGFPESSNVAIARYGHGLLDDVRIYDHALSASDIAGLVSSAIIPEPTTIILLGLGGLLGLVCRRR